MKKGLKYDQEKLPLDLIPYDSLCEISKVLKYGIKKYGSYNWTNGIEFSRLIAASLRHIYQFNDGEDYDQETKTLHIANAICNLLFLIWMYKNKPHFDDRQMKKIKNSIK